MNQCIIAVSVRHRRSLIFSQYQAVPPRDQRKTPTCPDSAEKWRMRCYGWAEAAKRDACVGSLRSYAVSTGTDSAFRQTSPKA